MRLGILGLVCVGAVACSSSSANEVPAVDSGSDASSDSGSDAGDGGTEAAVACTDDADCDDDDVCNGKETCSVGVCVAGQAPCANPDPAHCEATCDASSGAVVCGVQGRDADGDTHRDALCAQSPGTDCDDNDASVFPGANESCDGIDSNCNGVDDIDEPGFSLSGSPFVIAAVAGQNLRRPRAVWAEGAKQFGVVWTESDTGVYLQRLGATGDKVGSALKVDVTSTLSALDPNIAVDGQVFGVSWQGLGPAQGGPHFRSVTTTGAFASAEQFFGSGSGSSLPTLASNGSGFVAVWDSYGDTKVRQVASNGTLAPNTFDLSDAIPLSHARIGKLGSGYLVAWTRPSVLAVPTRNVVEFSILSATLSIQPPTVLKSAANGVEFRQPVVLGTESGAFVAWRAAEPGKGSLQVAEVTPTGTVACGPADVADHDAEVFVNGAALNGSERLVALLTKGSAARVELARFGEGCQSKPPLLVPGGTIVSDDNSASLPKGSAMTDVAVGDDSILVVWQERAGNDFVIKGRVFGKNFCD